jgi:hypothetical protein
VCGNVVFSVTVWRTVSLMWTGTESVKGDRIVLYRNYVKWVECGCNYDCHCDCCCSMKHVDMKL